jgi:Flp pilus assembly protein TadD
MKKRPQLHRTPVTARESASPPADRGPGGPPAWVAAVVLAFFLAIVYGPSLRTPFIFDDFPAVVENKSILSLWPLVGFSKPSVLNPPPELPVSGRPLVNLTFALNYFAGGYNSAGYHVVNLVLHFFAAMLLWAITRRTLRLPSFRGRFDLVAEWLALAVAVLWGLHPLLTETVIYVTQRTELMMGLFYLATLYCSLRYWHTASAKEKEQRGGPTTATNNRRAARVIWLVLAATACLCGMASKEVMVSAPLIVLLYERTFIAGSIRDAVRRSWPLYVGLAATWVPLLLLNLNSPHRDAAGFSFDVSGPHWWLTQSKVLFLYLKLCIWPAPLLIHYQIPYLTTLAEAWSYVVPLVLLGLATLILLWKNHPLGFLGAWFAAILSPTFVIPIFTEIAAERRMYLALVIPVVVFVVGGYKLLVLALGNRQGAAQPRDLPGTAIIFVGISTLTITAVFCFISVSRLVVYENELSLWISVLQAQPDNLRAILNVGAYLERTGNEDAAIHQYQSYFERADKYPDPSEAQMHNQLGQLLVKKGDFDRAILHLAEAVRVIPQSADLRNNLAYALFMAGRNDQAIDEYRAAIKVAPQHWPARKNLGEALLKAGKHHEALASFEVAQRLKPQSLEIYFSLANCHVRLNQRPKAIAILAQGLAQALAAGDAENARRFEATMETQQ